MRAQTISATVTLFFIHLFVLMFLITYNNYRTVEIVKWFLKLFEMKSLSSLSSYCSARTLLPCSTRVLSSNLGWGLLSFLVSAQSRSLHVGVTGDCDKFCCHYVILG